MSKSLVRLGDGDGLLRSITDLAKGVPRDLIDVVKKIIADLDPRLKPFANGDAVTDPAFYKRDDNFLVDGTGQRIRNDTNDAVADRVGADGKLYGKKNGKDVEIKNPTGQPIFDPDAIKELIKGLDDDQIRAIFANIRLKKKPSSDGLYEVTASQGALVKSIGEYNWRIPGDAGISSSKVIDQTGISKADLAAKKSGLFKACKKNMGTCLIAGGTAAAVLAMMIARGTADPFAALGMGVSSLVSNVAPAVKTTLDTFGDAFGNFIKQFWWIGVLGIVGVILMVVVLKMMK